MNTELPKCKCGDFLLIDKQHVEFKGGKVARIKCDGCNQTRRIAWELVKHLKEEQPESVTEDVKPELEEQPEDKDDLLKALEDAPQEKAAGEQKDNEGNGAGWIVAGLAGLAALAAVALKKGR